MSVTSNPSPGHPDIPGLDLGPSPTVPARRRHALGLPAGSVRALLALMVLGLLWAIVLLYNPEPDKEIPLLFVYLQYLMILILASFFAAHGSSIGTPVVDGRSPLGLPRGIIRLLLLAGFIGLAVWMYLNKREFIEPVKAPGTLPLILIGSFALGYLVTWAVKSLAGVQLPYWFQDVQAWLALLAMLGLGIELVLQFVINPRLENPLDLTQWEGILAAIVGFYFGARS